MTFTIKDWNRRFSQQARWSKELCEYVFSKTDLKGSAKVLEVGSGTGGFLHQTPNNLTKFGIDIALDRLKYGKKHSRKTHLACADAYSLPFPGRFFEMTVCHYLLLWLHEPLRVLREMKRVTKRGGIVAAFAEPDYGFTTGQSPVNVQIHALQKDSLIAQGANPLIGRKLAELFKKLDLADLESGRLFADTKIMIQRKDIDLEMRVIRNDINLLLDPNELKRLLHAWRQETEQNPSSQEVATFFAFGYVK